MAKYVTYWTPKNRPGTTISIIINAKSKKEAIEKVSKYTKSKARKYCTIYHENPT